MNRTFSMSTRLAQATFLATAVAAFGTARAQDNMLRLSVTHIDNHSRSNGITGVGAPPGADAKVGDATTLTFSYERFFTPNIGLELVLGVPVRTHADASGSVAYLGKDVLSSVVLAPTLFANYHFGKSGDTWRPYLGAGVNYSRFVKARTSLADSAKVGDSYGWAVQGGIEYAINETWSLMAGIARIDVKSRLVTTGATVLTTTIDYRPVTYTVGVDYRF